MGSGNQKLERNLPDWNLGKAYKNFGERAPFLLIADDAIGGFYLLNGGQLGDDLGKVYYLAPDTLEFEPLHLTYTDFLNFCFNSDLDEFYKGFRWKNWETDILNLDTNKVYNFYPTLWSKEGKNIEQNSRKAISIEEQYQLNLDLRSQLNKQ